MALSGQLAIVQSKFTSGENVIIAMEASLMQGHIKSRRLLALLNKGNTNALVILLTSRNPPQVYSDLTIERVIPIDQDFNCDIETATEQQDGLDVHLSVSSRKLRLVFEMRPGVETGAIVSEIFRAIEVYQKNKSSATDYLWIKKLTGSTRNLDSAAGDVRDSSDPLVELESPDLVVPRRNIASGKTPVAARESVVRYHMACKEDDYTYTEKLRIFVGTWNVNGQPPNGITVEEWLSGDQEPPDLYAVGFQELDLSKEAFLFNDTPREEEWRQVVKKSLHPKGTYHQVAIVRLVGMMLIIFAEEAHLSFIKTVSIDTVGTGIMGKMGNKGGVAVSMTVHNTSICFVNAHLAAHCEEYERRNQDYADICARLSFAKYMPPKNFKDHDQIYWLGDLNYRITEMDATIAKNHIMAGNYEPVLMLDQLCQQRQLGKVLQGFHEAKINFKPTYKYDPGTDNWDSSEKGRAPAWCDRVLWKGDAIASVDYRSHPVLKISDHKPVSAIFNSQVRVIDVAKYRKIHEEVMKKLDKLENEFLPQVMVDTTEIIFDVLKFLEPSSKELIIANTGQVPVQFEFIKKLDDTSYCKDWLHIEPYTGFIKPGEKCDIKLEVYVDKRSACKLNSGEDKLYDILVLHLEGGKDIFITVTGTYERSCFGSSMEALVHIPVPIREIPVGRIIELENNKNPAQEPYSVPKEVWFLVDRLYRHGIKTAGLFETPGLHGEIIAIRDWLDTGSLDPMPGGVHSVAESLLLLLESTSEPLVPYNLHNVCLSAATNYLQCKQIVMQLPEIRRNVFLYICAFLQELLNHAEDNGLDAKTLDRSIFTADMIPAMEQLFSLSVVHHRIKCIIVTTFTCDRCAPGEKMGSVGVVNLPSELPTPRRALLYIPASDARKVAKASTIDADLVVLDCEDGVAINKKEAARTTIADMLNKSSFPSSKPQWGVRVNSVNSGLCEQDLNVIFQVANKPPCILLPKVESIDEILWFTEAVKKLNPEKIQMDMIIYSETAASMMKLPQIIQAAIDACKKTMIKLVALVIGSDDYVANIGATRTKNCMEILYARQRLVMIAKAFELQAIDMVHIDIKDLDRLRETSIESATWGFTGRQVIHPSHVPIVQAAYSPSQSQIVWASELVKAFNLHQELGKGAFVFENQMIDMPTLRQAQNIVNLMKLSSSKRS